MKKLLLIPFLLTLAPLAQAQCEPAALPYTVNAEAATAPGLPECVNSNYESFASIEEFETIAGPIAGFEGNVLGYDTTVNTEFGLPPSTQVSASLYTRSFQLQQGVNYTVSYRYGNSGAAQTIDDVYVSVISGGMNSIEIAHQQGITGASPVNFASQAFAVTTGGTYMLVFSVYTTGTQGFFYLDDIVVQEAGGAIGAVAGHSLAAVSAYPNPAKDVVTLTGNLAIDSATLFSATGQKVAEQLFDATTATLNLQGLSAGVYMLNIASGNRRQTLKIVKE